jgi:general secretion pathway protein G
MVRLVRTGARPNARGFTLLEMMVVMTIIVTIVSIAVPFYSSAIVRARESVLRSNLLTIRSVIDQYTFDKETPPQSLEDLVQEGYLRQVPIDPITRSRDTWELIVETGPLGESGLFDVRSGSDGTSLAGTPYNEW